ncbi:MAG TPA: hypothetical protein VKU40_02715, partial [Thermoanaerobaculia bacterium]|nr:hypothetical protein [Thermoanaerobaculia bacterium]
MSGTPGAERRPWIGVALCAPLLAFLVACFAVPLAGLVPQSLTETGGVLGRPLDGGSDGASDSGLTLSNYSRALSRRGELTAFRNSF